MTSKMGKYCGSCKHFGNEDALGLGWCALNECETTCGSGCEKHETKKTREIKFRGKDIENDNDWRYGSLVVYPNGNTVIMCFDDDGNELSYDVDPETVGQFTGLHDADGREIYEGDIVKNKIAEFCGIVKYKDSAFVIDLGNTKGTLFACLQTETLEVIGNVHDNPELLKGGQDGQTAE